MAIIDHILALSGSSHSTLPPLIGEAPAFRAMLAQVSQLAALDRPVLVVGERGTGKELIAARLTYLSPRWDKPFIKPSIARRSPRALLDSELFGHEAGAFTGAARRRLSRFELADGGTLFLDEIANASLAVQEKILRVIEYGSFERVGGNEALLGRCARHRRDQCRSAGAGRRRALPQRSARPPRFRRRHAAAAARAARGHSAAGRAFRVAP